MAGIGEQRDRADREAHTRLDRDEAEVERDPDRERATEVGGRVRMPVTVPVPVPVPVVMRVIAVMMVPVRHAARLAGSAQVMLAPRALTATPDALHDATE